MRITEGRKIGVNKWNGSDVKLNFESYWEKRMIEVKKK